MSVEKQNPQKIINDLEDGEISDSNINKSDILKLIEENKNKAQSIISEDDEEDEEPIGFFHKMLKEEKVEEKSFLKKKRGGEEFEDEEEGFVKTEKKDTKRLANKSKKPEYKIQTKEKHGVKNSQKEHRTTQPKQICQYFINGACHKGKDCTYSHNTSLKKKQTELCKYFLSGNCFKGNECVFSHQTKEFPCKFYHAVGYCDKGETCKFSHQRLREEDVQSFVEQNEELLADHFKNHGKTNMDDFFKQHIQMKYKMSLEDFIEQNKNGNKNIGNFQKNVRMNFPQFHMTQQPGVVYPQQIPGVNPMMNMYLMRQNPQMMQNYMRMMQSMNKNIEIPKTTNFNPGNMTNYTIPPQNIQYSNFQPQNKNSNITSFMKTINPFQKEKIETTSTTRNNLDLNNIIQIVSNMTKQSDNTNNPNSNK